MENAIEAFKLAIAVMMFVMALTLSISSFSQANLAARSIINMRDKSMDYTYVEPSTELTREVGIETLVATMYRAYEENIEIRLIEQNSNNGVILYKKIDTNGVETPITSINLKNEQFANSKEAQEHLDIILGGIYGLSSEIQAQYTGGKYKLEEQQGLYNKYKNSRFIENLGEYYQEQGAAQIKKRVITYKIK